MSDPTKTKLRYKLKIFPVLEQSMSEKSFLFETKEEMLAASNTCADLLLWLQDGLKVMKDYSNIILQYHLQGDEWIEYEED